MRKAAVLVLVLGIAGAIGAARDATPVGSGLVAAYAFDEGAGPTTADASGNANTGSLSGAAWTVDGRNGGALSFDGVNDSVTVADAASLDLTTGMTLEAWLYPTGGGSWRTVVLKEQGSSGMSYALYSQTSAQLDRLHGRSRLRHLRRLSRRRRAGRDERDGVRLRRPPLRG